MLDEADKDKLEEALFKLATGYEYEETEVTATKDGRPIRVKKTKKHVPPNIKAIMLLKKPRANDFRDRKDSFFITNI